MINSIESNESGREGVAMRRVSKRHEELMAIYKIVIDDIRDSKHQQWRVIQLTLLAIAAIASVHKYFRGSVAPGLLEIMVWFVGGVGIAFILSFTHSLSKYRKKKESIRKHFTDTAKRIEETRLFSCWLEWVVNMFQTTPVFAILFSAFIGVAMYVAISIINRAS